MKIGNDLLFVSVCLGAAALSALGCELEKSNGPIKIGGTAGATSSSTVGSSSSSSSSAAGGGSTSGSAATGGGGKGGSGGAGGVAGAGGAATAGGASGAGGAATAGGAAGSGGLDVDASDDVGAGGAGGMGGATDDGGAPDGGTCAGYALVFDGAQNNAFLNRVVQDDFTLEAWIKTTSSLTGSSFWDGNGLIYADVQGNDNDFGMSILNNKIAFGLGNPDMTLVGSTDVTTGQWVHVAATRSASTGAIQVIVNGAADGSATSTNMGSLTAQSIILLGANTIDNHFFAGTMDEVRIWSVAKTADEIAASMHTRATGSEANLVGYYRFDDPGGAVSADGSPSMNGARFSDVPPTFVPSDAPICP
jgi:hypothetical protein